MMDARTDDGPWLYYKLTDEPKGSGELISFRGRFNLPCCFTTDVWCKNVFWRKEGLNCFCY